MSAQEPAKPDAQAHAADSPQAEGVALTRSNPSFGHGDEGDRPQFTFDPEHLLDLTHDAIFVMDMEGAIRYWNRGASETFGYPPEEALGRRAAELLRTEFDDDQDRVEADVLESGIWDGELTHHNRDGRDVVCATRWVAWEDLETGTPYLLEVSREITARKAAEHRADRERRQLLSVLNMIPGYVAIKGRDHRIRFANDGYLEAFGEPGGRPCYEIQHGRSSPCPNCRLQDAIDQLHSGQWEATCVNGRSYRVWIYPFRMSNGEQTALELGIDITEEQAALRLITQAGETERRQIGRDLHDSIGQKLSAMSYLLGGLVDGFQEISPQQQALADQAADLARECVSEIRSIARGLNPVDLASEGLHDALHELARSLEATSELECTPHIDPSIDLDSGTALNLYRIAQEATSNAIRHGNAESIDLSLERVDGHALLRVRDDGIGIDAGQLEPAQAGNEGGLGLQTMQHRAKNIHARLTISSGIEGGTVVTCSVPLPD